MEARCERVDVEVWRYGGMEDRCTRADVQT